MIDYLTAGLLFASCIYIFYRVEPLIERVSWRDTPVKILIPFAFIVLSVLAGATGQILYSLSGHIPQWHETFLTLGIALALFCDRRGIISRLP